ncbi:hypothetical protein CRG98_021098, partial [Punica granatum]
MYSFRDPPHVLLQGLRVLGLRVRIYCFRDFRTPDIASAFTTSGTSVPRTSRSHVLLQGLRVPGLRVRMYSFRDPPHVLLQGLRVLGLRVRIYCFRDFRTPDIASAFTTSGTSVPRTSRSH